MPTDAMGICLFIYVTDLALAMCSLKPENVEDPEGSETWFLLSAKFIT